MNDTQMVFAESPGTYNCDTQVCHLHETNIGGPLADTTLNKSRISTDLSEG